MSLPLFSLSLLPFFLSFPVHSPFHLYPKSLSIAVVPAPPDPPILRQPSLSSLNFLPPIILSPSVSLRHVFQDPPSIDTVSTNSSPPVPSQEPLEGEGWRRESQARASEGKACWVRGYMVKLGRRSPALLPDDDTWSRHQGNTLKPPTVVPEEGKKQHTHDSL